MFIHYYKGIFKLFNKNKESNSLLISTNFNLTIPLSTLLYFPPLNSVSPQPLQPLEVLYEDPKEDSASILSEVRITSILLMTYDTIGCSMYNY